MKYKKLTGTKVPRFTYDTPQKAENDFYDLCAGETPLVMIFLANFGHPISRAYLNAYLQTVQQLTAGRLACVVRSDPQRIAEQFGDAAFPFTVICDADGVLYDYFEVRETNRFFDWTFAARRIINEAKKEGYQPEKGAMHLLPLTMFLGQEGEVLYAHRGRSLTDLPEDCIAIEDVCLRLAARQYEQEAEEEIEEDAGVEPQEEQAIEWMAQEEAVPDAQAVANVQDAEATDLAAEAAPDLLEALPELALLDPVEPEATVQENAAQADAIATAEVQVSPAPATQDDQAAQLEKLMNELKKQRET